MILSKKWFLTQKLYWNGIEYSRDSKEYQEHIKYVKDYKKIEYEL
jgi:hypothetical protein